MKMSTNVRRRVAVVVAVAVTGFGAAAVAPTVDGVAIAPVASAKSCSGSYTHAGLPWGHKCLRRGQFCAIAGDRSYHRYGFHCHGSSRDSRGNYHLTS